VLAELAPCQDAEVLWSAADTALVPVFPFNMRGGDHAISMFAIIATLATAEDVTPPRPCGDWATYSPQKCGERGLKPNSLI